MQQNDSWKPCDECCLSAKRYADVESGELQSEQFVDEIIGRLVNDGDEAQPDLSLLGPRVTTNYHCQSCSMEWQIVRTEGAEPLVLYDKLGPADPPNTTAQ